MIQRPRASMYFAVLGTAMIVSVVGLSALVAVRTQREGADVTSSATGAMTLSRAAIDLAMLYIASDPDWRTNRGQGLWKDRFPLGLGSISIEAIDLDGDITDSHEDSVILRGIGYLGDARTMLEVTLVPQLGPLDALNTAIHSENALVVDLLRTLNVSGAPASTNGTAYNNGTIRGDLHAQALVGFAPASGTATVPGPLKDLPESTVFQTYRDRATALPFVSALEKTAIGPAYTPWGLTNADGIYYINTGGQDLSIKGIRIHGTLIVDCPGRTVELDTAVFLHPVRKDLPTLIVNGGLRFKYAGGASGLREADWATNFNPAAVPYSGHSDTDQIDTYPSEVHGLVYAQGSVEFSDNAVVRGVVLSSGGVAVRAAPTLYHDPDLFNSPPAGFTAVKSMAVAPESWRRVASP